MKRHKTLGGIKGSVEETREEVPKCIPNGGADIKKNVEADGRNQQFVMD